MDTGRAWALQTFGMYGPLVRERIPEMVIAEHEGSLDAQDASGHRSRGVYGQFWRGILEKFETLAIYPGASLISPGDAPYKIPVINGVALFPWRYASTLDLELADVPFGTSDSRMTMGSLRPQPIQEEFDLGLPDPGLSEEERELLEAFNSATQDPVVSTGRLVLVAIASSVRGLFRTSWGEVELKPSGYVDWAGFNESLIAMDPPRLASTTPVRTFTAGELPSKFPESETEQTGDGQGDV